jgi:hypothetical protein
MKEQIIQLEKHDDAVSVRDRLGFLQADRVLLVWPADGAILQRKLDLVLIQREAARMNARLGLVTDDFTVIEHADELRIPVFYSVREGRRIRYWPREPLRLFTGRSDRPKRGRAPTTAELIAESQRPVILPPEFMAVRRVLSWIIFATVVAVLLFGLYVIVPGARITLKPAADQVSVTVPVVADPELAAINLIDRAVPARIVGVEVEWSTTVSTTGVVNQPTTGATGWVLFSNLLADEVSVPAGTVVRTTAADPVRFQTTEGVLVPAGIAATAEAPIEAMPEFAGLAGNVGANLINRVEGPLGVRLGASNTEPTRGGGITEAAAVAREDYERLRSALLQQLQQRAYAEISTPEWIAPTEFIATGSLAVVLVLDETYSEYIGQPAENVSLEMRVVVQGVAIDEMYARQVVYGALADRVGPGFRILDDTLTFVRGDELGVDDERRVTFLMSCTGDVASAINTDAVRNRLAGLPVDRAVAGLGGEFPLKQDPSVELWPGWFGRMPVLPIRIDVNVDYTR